MSLLFGPFDAGAGSSITEDFWVKMARLWLKTGVARGELSEYAVFADSTGMQVKVPTGRAWVEGQYCENDAQATLAVTAAHATLARIDRVVLRKDSVGNTFALVVLAGTPASTPAAPALTQTSSTWDMPLAQVLVPAAASTITAGNVTDERTLVQNVDINAVQTLANKTLTTPTIGSLTNAQHSHQNAAGGGALAAPVISSFVSAPHTHQDAANGGAIPAALTLAPRAWVPAEAFSVVSGAVLGQNTSGNTHWYWEFRDAQGDYVAAEVWIPTNYAGGNITFRVKYYLVVAAGGTVYWRLNGTVLGDGISAVNGYAALVDNNHTAPGSVNLLGTAPLVYPTPASNAGSWFPFAIQRLGGSDSNSGTARMVGVAVEFGA